MKHEIQSLENQKSIIIHWAQRFNIIFDHIWSNSGHDFAINSYTYKTYLIEEPSAEFQERIFEACLFCNLF